jgi:3-methyladenine DNA glycosylase AlkD
MSKPDFRKLAKHLYEKAEREGISLHIPDPEREKLVEKLLKNVKYNGGEQKEMSKKSWKSKLRNYAIMATAMATGAIVIVSTSSAGQSVYGGHN